MSQKSFDSYNEFLMEGGLDRFTKILCRYEFFREIMNKPGDIVECGVYKGQGLLFWAKLIQIFNPLSIRKVVGFDTFTGVPVSVKGKDDRASASSFKNYGNVPRLVTQQAKKFDLKNRIEIVAGDALKTIPEYVEKNPGFRIALLNMDFDVYEPTKAALARLWERVIPGGLILLDEYAVANWGESNAVDEFLKEKNIAVELKSIPWALSPTAYFRKT